MSLTRSDDEEIDVMFGPLRIKRSDHERIILVPDQWSGTVQQYYHFLLGYLAP